MQITLTDNRTIALVRLTQWLTYRGLLAGIPFRRMNQETIDYALEKASAECLDGLNPVLIPPVATPVPYQARPRPSPSPLSGDGSSEGEKQQWNSRHYETLPAVACIGHFDSGALKRPGSEPYSSLVVVWFQDRFAAPIDADVRVQIERLDWEGLAKDWIW
jgi:hypothetical protein